jgi:hypothetical protein
MLFFNSFALLFIRWSGVCRLRQYLQDAEGDEAGEPLLLHRRLLYALRHLSGVREVFAVPELEEWQWR